ncbi:MAG: TolC family protein, partial [Bdellovibrionales bacterium]|nr:TolC family protein [Bdellovibrionales bacterium]
KDIREFVNKYFLVGQSIKETQEASHQLVALKHHAASGEFAAKMEKARYLPQVGVFAESYMFQGERDTADGYMAGLYLRWNLFNSSDYGAYSEAQLKAKSAQKYFVAMEQKERAEKKSYHQVLDSLNKTIELLNDSDRMLGEQIETTRTLFRNGSINALQMVEVLNRRVDLITQLNQAENELLNVASKTVSLRSTNLDAILPTEGGNTK